MGYEKVKVNPHQEAILKRNSKVNLGNADLPELIYFKDSQSAPVDLSGVSDQGLKRVSLRGT